MQQVILAHNPLEPDTWTTHDVEDVRDFLMEEFTEWPSTARIYHKYVSSATDVTPADERGIERLGELDGPFIVVVYAADPVTIIIAVVAVVAVAAVVLAMMPPTPTLRNTQNESPNNELSDRANQARPLARIPDIFGEVRSTPDLVAVPWKAFINHEEVEYAYMCIGRGQYYIGDVRDDTTPVSDIAGTAVEVYAPFTSPNSGDDPQLRIGGPIGKAIQKITRSNAVNGQVLRPPNAANIVGNNNITFSSPNVISGTGVDFTDSFASGDSLTVANSSVTVNSYADYRTIFASSAGWFQFEIPTSTLPSEYQVGRQIDLVGATFNVKDSDGFVIDTYDLNGRYTISNVQSVLDGSTYYCRVTLTNPSAINGDWASAVDTVSDSASIIIYGQISTFDLDGTYDVLTVSATTITLSNPSSVNSNWSSLTTSTPASPILSTSGDKWIGPFVMDINDAAEISSNFVALNGLYKDDGKNQQRFDVQVLLEITPINADGTPRASVQTATATIQGSAESRSTRAVTLQVSLNDPGLVKVRAKRVTAADLNFEGSVVDEVKWRDVYTMAPISATHFGNVTTVQSVTYATSGALALKERKLNMLATRLIEARHAQTYDFGDNNDWSEYYATTLDFSESTLRCVNTASGNFGAMVAIPEFTTGQQFTIGFELKGFGPMSSLTVALYEPGGPGLGSSAVTVSAIGTHSVTLTANRNSGGTGVAKILIYRVSAAQNSTFTIDNVEIAGPSYSNAYGFKGIDDVSAYGTVTFDQSSGNLLVTSAPGGNFGFMIDLPEFATGDQMTLSLDIDSLNVSSIKVALYESNGTGTASNTPGWSSTGAKTATLTATRDSGGTGVAKLLVYALSASAGQSFAVDNLSFEFEPSVPRASKRADDVFIALCKDPYIGNRADDEIDKTEVHTALDDVRDYFGSEEAGEFCYTFDSDNLSFEESAQSVAQAVFSTAYRRGNVIKLRFNRETEDSALLFNHRNKLPGSETRTVRFGNESNYDGVEFTYVSPDDDAILTYYIPTDRSAVNPQKVESLGVRSPLQAHFHAWRAWQRIQYQNTFTEFTATQEADLLLVNDRVLVADNTRTGTQDGEVVAQNVLELELSQPVTMQAGVSYTIFLQHTDGTVESIGITAGSDAYHVVLAQAPRLPLALNENLFARATYMVVGDNEPRGVAFLVGEKEPQSNFTSLIRAVNYDSRYYAKDKDLISGVVNGSGIIL